jgi:hypothetical protein
MGAGFGGELGAVHPWLGEAGRQRKVGGGGSAGLARGGRKVGGGPRGPKG